MQVAVRDQSSGSEDSGKALAVDPSVEGYPQPEQVDLIAGGFPCQDLSTASATRTGLNGERSGLWWEMLRTIRLVRPKYFLVENVAAILNRGRMDVFLGSVAEAGFDAEWDCVPAKEIGAPHERDRFFALAYANEIMGQTRDRDHQPKAPIFAGTRREYAEFWAKTTPPRSRMDDGLSSGLYADRVEALGNAVVPQVAEWIGRRIIEFDNKF